MANLFGTKGFIFEQLDIYPEREAQVGFDIEFGSVKRHAEFVFKSNEGYTDFVTRFAAYLECLFDDPAHPEDSKFAEIATLGYARKLFDDALLMFIKDTVANPETSD